MDRYEYEFAGIIPDALLLIMEESVVYVNDDGVMLGVCWKLPSVPDRHHYEGGAIGKRVTEVALRPRDGELFMDALRQAIATGEESRYWLDLQTDEGVRLCEVRMIPNFQNGHIALFRDFTDTKFAKVLAKLSAFSTMAGQLSEEERIALACQLEGKSAEQAAEELHLSVRTVRRRLKTAKDTIADDTIQATLDNVKNALISILRQQ